MTIRWRPIVVDRPNLARNTRPTSSQASASVSSLPAILRAAVCMACDTKLTLEGIPEKVQRAFCVTRNGVVSFTRLEDGPHHDGVRFGNGAEVTHAGAWYRCAGLGF